MRTRKTLESFRNHMKKAISFDDAVTEFLSKVAKEPKKKHFISFRNPWADKNSCDPPGSTNSFIDIIWNDSLFESGPTKYRIIKGDYRGKDGKPENLLPRTFEFLRSSGFGYPHENLDMDDDMIRKLCNIIREERFTDVERQW